MCAEYFSRYVLPANGDAAAALWKQKMDTGVLSAIHFRDYWRVTVPRVYALELNGNCLGMYIIFCHYKITFLNII